MDYETLASAIKISQIKRVMVTGPQRAGTTIASIILADVLGYEFIKEERLQDKIGMPHQLWLLFKCYQEKEQNIVVQAPALSAWCHLVPGAVVFVNRDVDEILASQERIRWTENYEQIEKGKYFNETKHRIPIVKYFMWEKFQKNNMCGIPFELDYKSLEKHPLFIPKSKRKDFTSRQTEL